MRSKSSAKSKKPAVGAAASREYLKAFNCDECGGMGKVVQDRIRVLHRVDCARSVRIRGRV